MLNFTCVSDDGVEAFFPVGKAVVSIHSESHLLDLVGWPVATTKVVQCMMFLIFWAFELVVLT